MPAGSHNKIPLDLSDTGQIERVGYMPYALCIVQRTYERADKSLILILIIYDLLQHYAYACDDRACDEHFFAARKQT